ncbi:MAG: VCBS repeat-containing protein [candidate division WOR-3 bacterium]|nr:VCBS repeat-containing protein [candidate division WOR-3 bacterium]MDW8150301.1 VCBS repeat-containing protein [candidate division WOR-3 bacterium]
MFKLFLSFFHLGGEIMRNFLIFVLFSRVYAEVRSLDEESPFQRSVVQKFYEVVSNKNLPVVQSGPITFFEDTSCISSTFSYMVKILSPNNRLIGDFDNNGYNDIVSAYVYDANCFGAIVGCFQNSSGNFIFKRINTEYLACPYGISAHDLNNDGRTDFVYVDAGAGEVMRLINNGNQNFSDQYVVVSSVSDTFYYINHVAVISPNEILFTDEGRSSGQNQGLHRWNGISSSKINNYCTEGLAIGDLDNNGQTDAVCTRGYFRSPGNVVFQLKQGVNWSSVYNVTSSPGNFHGVAVGDINNDGRLDVVFTDDQNDAVVVYRNNGGSPPSFSQLTSVPVSSNLMGSEATLYDLDCDGDLDIIWSRGMGRREGYTQPGPALGWIRNPTIGGGGWTNYIIDNSINSNYGAVVGLVNNDTRPDIVVGGHNTDAFEMAFLRIFYNVAGGNCGTTPVGNNETDSDLSLVIKNKKVILISKVYDKTKFFIYSTSGQKVFEDYLMGQAEVPLKSGSYILRFKDKLIPFIVN